MAYYYVCTNTGTLVGTRTSAGAGTQQTGAFGSTGLEAGDIYATIGDVFTYNTIAAGDFICVSSAHDASSSGFTGVGTGIQFYTIISVDNSNAGQYLAGAKETSATDYTITSLLNHCVIYGVEFSTATGFLLDNDAQGIRFYDCTFSCQDNVADQVLDFANDPCVAEFYNCVFNHGYTGTSLPSFIYARYNPRLYFDSCAFSVSNTGTGFYLLDQGNVDGFEVKLTNCIIAGTGDLTLIDTAGSSDQEGACSVEMKNCRFPSTWSFFDSTPLTLSIDVSIWNCDDGNKYTTGRANMLGTAITQSTYARSGGAEIDGTAVAYAVTTTSGCQREIIGFRFLLATVQADFGTAKTVTAYMQYASASAADLQDDQIWLEVHVPKASTPDMTVYSSKLNSSSQGGVIWTDAPADYPNNTETWSGSLSNAVKQSMSITTAGSEDSGIAQVYVVVAAPSTTVYIDPSVVIA